MLLAMLGASKLSADCCCNPHIIDIYYVPFHIDGTINPSNTTYCVTQNLTYLGGEGLPSAAITVDPGVHDIVINFNGFELDIDPSVDGISMLGTSGQPITDVLIKDGVIKSLSPSASNNGILTTNFNTVTVDHMRFVDERRGIAAPFQTDANFNLNVVSSVFDLKGVTGVSRRGIALSTIQGLRVEDSSFLPNDPNESPAGGTGILLVNNAKDVFIKRCTFDGQTQRGIVAQSIFNPDTGFFFTFPSSNIQVDECEFSNINGDTTLPFDAGFVGVSNVQVTNSSFYGVGNNAGSLSFEVSINSQNTLASPIPSGFLVDGCTFTSTAQGYAPDSYRYACVFAGSAGGIPESIYARDITIRNSTFTHQGAPARADDVLFIAVEGAIVENCVFDSTASGRIEGCVPATILGVPTKSANIHLGGTRENITQTEAIGGGSVRDITIRANQICGAAQVGIVAETGIGTTPNQRITIEDNSITAREAGIYFANTNSSTIIGNRVQGVNGSSCRRGVGIELEGPESFNPAASSNSNAILDNIVTNNQIGVLIECGAQGNLVKGNIVYNNSKHQIKEEKKHTNKIDCNTTGDHAIENVSCSSSSSR